MASLLILLNFRVSQARPECRKINHFTPESFIASAEKSVSTTKESRFKTQHIFTKSLQITILFLNSIQNKLRDADKTQIDSLLTQLEALLSPKLVGLGPEDRQKYGAINEQNKLFVNKVNDFVETQAAHSPSEVDWNEFKADYVARQFLETGANRLTALAYQMESTKMLHDYDNYQDSLAYYEYVSYRASRNVPGAAEIYNELKQFFAKTRTDSDTADNTSPNT